MGLSRDKLLSVVTEEEIWNKYFGPFKLKKLYMSPLRNEKHPSFNIYKNTAGRLMYKDFGGDGGDVFDFIMNKYRVSFTSAINFVANDFGIGEETEFKPRYREQTPYVEIGVRKTFTWTEKGYPDFGEQIDFWEKYGITLDILKEYEVKNIVDYSFFNDAGDKKVRKSVPFNPIYMFVHNEDGDAVRFYMPKTKLKPLKWCGNTMYFDVFGLKQIKEHQEIIGLLAGQKDCLSLYANTRIRAVSLQSESTELHDEIYQDIRNKCDKMFVLYDNDKAGRFYARKIHEKYNIPIIELEKVTKLKDTSDYYEWLNKNPGTDELYNLIRKTLND